MAAPKLVLLVKFKSRLALDAVIEVVHSRADAFRALPGLTQKYYLRDEATGEYAGLYFWDSPESFTEFRDSELRATIAKAYQVEGEPRVEVFEVLTPLRPGAHV
jgi:heme-degrading monooxygenase HmoA